MKVTPKYHPGDKVELISGTHWWINCVQVFKSYHTYNVWNGETTFVNVDEDQISRKIEGKKGGFYIDLPE